MIDLTPPMKSFDVFNGDADGICALHQLRLAYPIDSRLITGVKRDISLLHQVDAQAGDEITVLDISLDKNRSALEQLLKKGALIRYFDHHFAGEIPQHDNLQAHIDTSANVCSSLLVNDYLKNQHLPWAVVAAFGDNLFDSARKAAAPLHYNEDQLKLLRQLGTYINYNGYGSKLEDLFFNPEHLYRIIHDYIDPFEFIQSAKEFKTLQQGYNEDMANAAAIKATSENSIFAVYILPNATWANRVSGVYANQLAQQYPDRAHAILTTQLDNNYLVSVRAALTNKTGADEVCRQFETGGGRKAAAGINNLPQGEYERFIEVLGKVFA